MTPLDDLKARLLAGDPAFWSILAERSQAATTFDDLFFLSRLRRQAAQRLPAPAGKPIRIALLGGCSLHPLQEIFEELLTSAGFACTFFVGEYDNYNAEIRDQSSPLYKFSPNVTVILPAERRCRYEGALSDSHAVQREQADQHVSELLQLCEAIHRGTDSEVLLANYGLPAGFDPGTYRTRTLGSDWNFRKLVNLEIGLRAPAYVHICDLEFLACRRGLCVSRDARAWFESKQPGSPELLVDLARELTHLVRSLRSPPAKVAVLDLDNTLWGGVIGDDGLDGIEIGDTSPRGEAFKDFQRQLLALNRRGVLLAVCSKNDHAIAVEPFEKHPEMVLRMEHFAAFYANWNPKSDNLRAIAADLNLGLDSLIFIDDNPAEIEIVRQFVPEVRTILLGEDPGTYASQLEDCRYFEPLTVTVEDLARGEQYRQEQQRRALRASVTDMDAYLASLEMVSEIREFVPVDVPRITQLINKSNQFNLTTIRRTESEVHGLMTDADHVCFTVRLSDRFGDHGLISVVIGKVCVDKASRDLEIDTWVMSCRVLKRQVEQEVTNEVFRLARLRGCQRVVGRYLPTAKNDMVRDLYATLGFATIAEDATSRVFGRDVTAYEPFATSIRLLRRSYES
jgi:FkbH-like protein